MCPLGIPQHAPPLAAPGGVAAPVGDYAGVIAHPEPPYTASYHEKLKDGLPCYYPECTSMFHSFDRIFNHVRSFHHVQVKLLKGSYFHTQACNDINAKQNARNQQKKVGDVQPAPTVAVPCSPQGSASSWGCAQHQGWTPISQYQHHCTC